MKALYFVALMLLGAVWGASFLFIDIAVDEFGPIPLMFMRVLLGGLLLVLVAYITKPKVVLNLRQKWRTYLMLGLLNSALPFTLIAFSELTINVSLAAILNSTTPLFTAIVASIWGHEKMTKRKTIGGLLGISGVIVLMGGSPQEQGAGFIIAVLASLLAALCYGTATVYASKHVTGLPTIYAAIVQLLSAAIILGPPASLALPPVLPSFRSVMALSALVFFSTTCAYLLYFYLLKQVGPTRTASVTFLVPVFGSIWGIIFLQELFTLSMLFGMLIIFTSVGLVMGVQWGKAKSSQLTK